MDWSKNTVATTPTDLNTYSATDMTEYHDRLVALPHETLVAIAEELLSEKPTDEINALLDELAATEPPAEVPVEQGGGMPV